MYHIYRNQGVVEVEILAQCPDVFGKAFSAHNGSIDAVELWLRQGFGIIFSIFVFWLSWMDQGSYLAFPCHIFTSIYLLGVL